jgi:hypothetical protein
MALCRDFYYFFFADLYQQLIESSDLVKELDDIEAISQQISQHAEVLYQTWKNNGMTNGPGIDFSKLHFGRKKTCDEFSPQKQTDIILSEYCRAYNFKCLSIGSF